MSANQSLILSDSQKKKFETWLYVFWVYTLLCILWGAWVRISHSGDGCGDHWPLCDGKMIPAFDDHKTWIEYTHRLMTGIYGLIVFYIFYFIRFGKLKNYFSSTTQKLNVALLVVMLIEAALGALLVKAELVTVNDSIHRLIVMSLHQLNSFILTGVSYLLAVSISSQISFSFQFKRSKFIYLFLAVAMTGAFAALATTLFPSASLWEGILQDLQVNTHLFLRLRIVHPLLALIGMGSLIYYFYNKGQTRLAFEIFAAIFIGVITLLTLSPIWLKLTHLIMGHYLWCRILDSQFVRLK